MRRLLGDDPKLGRFCRGRCRGDNRCVMLVLLMLCRCRDSGCRMVVLRSRRSRNKDRSTLAARIVRIAAVPNLAIRSGEESVASSVAYGDSRESRLWLIFNLLKDLVDGVEAV